MLVEGVTGKNYITNEEYSDEQRGIRIATLGAGSLLGKALSKVTTETVATEEAASVSKTGGIVLSMNGTGELDNLFNKITKNVVDDSKSIVNEEVNSIYENQSPYDVSKWTGFLNNKFGYSNVTWETEITSFDDIVNNPKALWGKSAEDVQEVIMG